MNIYSNNITKILGNLKVEQGCSYVFAGSKGLGKCLAAKQFIADKLDCKDLSVQPDVMIIEPDDGSIKIDQIREIGEFMSFLPANGEVKYVLIDDADTMTIATQNALLKSLEESVYTIFFLITHEPILLDTIMSRSKLVQFDTVSDEELERWLIVQGMSVDKFLLQLCDGRVGLYMNYANVSVNPFIEDCKRILEGISKLTNRRELLELFCCVKEKDKNMFFDKYENEEIKLFYNLLKKYFYRSMLALALGHEKEEETLVNKLMEQYSLKGIINIIERISADTKLLSKKGSYNKNDFFDLVRYMTIVE